MKSILYLLSFLFLSYYSHSQEIISKVIDIHSNEPIVFATIKIKNKGLGVIADENGNFRLPLQYKQQKDTLIISSIGYTNKEVAIDLLKNSKINILKLIPKVETLSEVVLVSKRKTVRNETSVRKIINQAIKNIDINYPKNPFSYIGYYRDYQLLKGNYINLNEAIVQVYDAGFFTDKIKNSLNQSVLYNYKKNTDFIRDPNLAGTYNESKYIKNATLSSHGGNELTILNTHDPIRNHNKESFSFIGVFNRDFLLNHTFRLERTLFLDDIELYEISFNTTKYILGQEYNAKGIIYISKDVLAIHKLEYDVNTKNKKDPLFTVKIEYSKKGDLMFLNYISFNNEFEVKSKNAFKIEEISFEKTENAFYLNFNNDIKPNSINNERNYKFVYKNKKLDIRDIVLIEPKIIKVTLAENSIDTIQIDAINSSDFKYSIKNIVDFANRKINKPSVTKVNQLREFFVQEAFKNKPLSYDNYHIRKAVNLSESIINNNENVKKYWINSPLREVNK